MLEAASGIPVSSGVCSAAWEVRAGTLLLIEKGDRHEVRNTGRALLRTLNVYVPPAYDASGEPLPRGKPWTCKAQHPRGAVLRTACGSSAKRKRSAR